MAKVNIIDNKLVRFLCAAIIAVAFVCAVYFTCGIRYATNDDTFLVEMFTGKLSGVPSYHSANVNAFITFPIMCLYRGLPSVPWWGLFLLIVLLVCIVICLMTVFAKAKNLLQLVCGMAIVMGAFVAEVYLFGQIQYTSVAVILAIAGFVALWGSESKKSGLIIFFICQLISFGIRKQSMLLAQPIGFGLLLGQQLSAHKGEIFKEWKNIAKSIVIPAVLALISIAVAMLVTLVSFSETKWKTYLKWDEVRVSLVDYSEEIPYEYLESTLSKYDISKEEYEALLDHRYWYPDFKFSKECIDELTLEVKEYRHTHSNNIIPGFSIFYLLYAAEEFWNINKCICVLFVLCILLGIFGKKKEVFPTLGILAGYLVGIVALALRFRFVLRVMMAYYGGVFLLLSVMLAIALYEESEALKNRKALIITALSLIIFTGSVVVTGKSQYSFVRPRNKIVSETNCAVMRDITNYCNANPDNHYIVDLSYSFDSVPSIFETDLFEPANYIYAGNWYSAAPDMLKWGKQYFEEKDLFFLAYEAQEWKGLDGLGFYGSCFGKEPEAADAFMVENGATIWVFKLN